MNIKKYKIIILPQFKKEFYKTFGYISDYKIFNQIIQKLQQLESMPQLFAKTEQCDELGRRYRKIIIKQYIILYCIDEQKKHIYISHIFYKKSNYFNKLNQKF